MKLKSIGLLFTSLTLAFSAQAAGPADGTWTSACHKENNQNIVNEIVVASTNMTQHIRAYSDADCKTQAMAIEVVGTAKYGPESQIVAGAKEVDYINSKINFTANDATLVGYLNAAQFCGYSDWAPGQTKDITGKTCGETTMPKQGDEHYDIYAIPMDGKLLYGKPTKEYDGKTPEKRVRQLDVDHPLMKK